MTEGQVTKKKRRLRRWVRLVLILVGVPVVVGLVLWFGVPPDVPDAPVHLVRGKDGRFVRVGESAARPKLSFEVHGGTIEANNALNTSSSVVSTDRSCFPCRKIVILNLSDHLLLARVGARLVEHLKQLKGPDQIDHYPCGFWPEEGEAAPDVFITLDLGSIEESGLGSRKLDAQILVSAGRAVAASRHGYHDSFSPPVLDFDWQGKLHHRSTTTGTGSRSSRYKLQAENIAKQIAHSLTKQMDQWREKYGGLADLPKAFYPPYRTPPEMPFLETYGAERLTACHGLMTHNETFWRFSTDRNPLEVVNDIRTQMESAGWGQATVVGKADERPHLRISRGGAALNVFVHEGREGVPGVTVMPGGAAKPTEPKTFCVHYLDRMTQAESKAAVEQMLADNVPVDTLVLFPLDWTKAQHERISSMAAKRPPRSVRTWLALAKLHNHQSQGRAARDALTRAHALNHTVSGEVDLSDEIRRLGKELGDETLHKKALDETLCRELGFIELKPGVAVPELEVGLDEPVVFFGRTDTNQLKTITVRVVRGADADGRPVYQLAHVDVCGGGRMWGTTVTVTEGVPTGRQTRLDGVCAVVTRAEKVPGKERFWVSVELVPDRKGPGNG